MRDPDPDRVAEMVDESTIHAHLYGSRRDAAASFQNRNRKLIVEVERDLGSIFQVLLWSILYGGYLGMDRSSAFRARRRSSLKPQIGSW